jgi:hypothetical protein
MWAFRLARWWTRKRQVKLGSVVGTAADFTGRHADVVALVCIYLASVLLPRCFGNIRVAAQISAVLQGKHKPIWHQSVDCGDHVVITNTKVRSPSRRWCFADGC